MLSNVYLDRLDRQWTARGKGVLVRYADDMIVICRTRHEAERALVALRVILSELGLTLKDDKTRIMELRDGGEGLDFLGFHHRWVRGNTPNSKHLRFLARWPSRQAMARARITSCPARGYRRTGEFCLGPPSAPSSSRAVAPRVGDKGGAVPVARDTARHGRLWSGDLMLRGLVR